MTTQQKLTEEEREKLNSEKPGDVLGYDCHGNVIKVGDRVEVCEEDSERSGKHEFAFCGAGKRGVAVRLEHRLLCRCIMSVEFPSGQTYIRVGCLDSQLRRIS